MPNTKKQGLQDIVLETLNRLSVPVRIFLVNGVQLKGVVAHMDSYCILLSQYGDVQLVYKHAISTILPAEHLPLYDASKDI